MYFALLLMSISHGRIMLWNNWALLGITGKEPFQLAEEFVLSLIFAQGKAVQLKQ